MKASRRTLRSCGLLLAFLVLGCGRNEKLTPVQGRVFYRHRPLPGGTIVFTPDVERGGSGPLACGVIDADGHYTLHTGDKLGVAPGWHRVTIAPPSEMAGTGVSGTGMGGTGVPPVHIELPRQYSDPTQSGLFCRIVADAAGEQDFHLE